MNPPPLCKQIMLTPYEFLLCVNDTGLRHPLLPFASITELVRFHVRFLCVCAGHIIYRTHAPTYAQFSQL